MGCAATGMTWCCLPETQGPSVHAHEPQGMQAVAYRLGAEPGPEGRKKERRGFQFPGRLRSAKGRGRPKGIAGSEPVWLHMREAAGLTAGRQAEHLVGSAGGGCAQGRQAPFYHDSGPGSVHIAPAVAGGAAS